MRDYGGFLQCRANNFTQTPGKDRRQGMVETGSQMRIEFEEALQQGTINIESFDRHTGYDVSCRGQLVEK